MPHFGKNGSLAAVERFLTRGVGEPTDFPPLDALEETGLAAFAATFPGGAPLRRALLTASASHMAVKAELQRLLRAWQGAGIEALLFKGFHLAEFVYPAPAGRQYSDVDLLIEGRNALTAAAVATAEGWQETWHAQRQGSAHTLRGARYHGHEVIQLLHPRIGIQLDVHRRLVHNNHNRIRRYAAQERITRMVWRESEVADWEGVRVRLPRPADAVLVGLVLNRCWSPEDFELRSHDYLDFRFLVEKYGLDLEVLQRRAVELGCPRTFELFLERCDPYRRRCVLSKPTRIELQRWNLLIAAERGNRYLERGWIAANELPRDVLAVFRHLPGVVRVLAVIERCGGVRAALEEFRPDPSGARELDPMAWQRMRQSVHRALRIVGYGGRIGRRLADSDRDVEALALLAALHRRSCPATLEWGLSGDGERRPLLVLDGKPLNLSGTLLSRRSPSPKQRRPFGRGRQPT